MENRKEQPIPILVRFPPDLARWLQGYSQSEQRSMTQIVVDAITQERDRSAKENSSFEMACEAFTIAVNDSPKDDARWNALVELLPYFQLRRSSSPIIMDEPIRHEGNTSATVLRRVAIIDDPKEEHYSSTAPKSTKRRKPRKPSR